VQKQKEIPPVVHPHDTCQGGVKAATGLFPYGRELHEGVYVRTLQSGRVFTLQTEGVYVVRVPFNPEFWRRSIVVSDNQWSLLKNNFHVLKEVISGYYDASVRIPWDVTQEEFDQIDLLCGGQAHQELRKHYYLNRPMEYSKLLLKYKVQGEQITLLQWVERQREFEVRTNPHNKFVEIRRNLSSHLLAEFKYHSVWDVDLMEWRKLGWKGYLKIDQAKLLQQSRGLV